MVVTPSFGSSIHDVFAENLLVDFTDILVAGSVIRREIGVEVVFIRASTYAKMTASAGSSEPSAKIMLFSENAIG
jgi:hypothetical protein